MDKLMPKIMKIVILMLLTCIFESGSAIASEYYVSTEGSNGNPGSLALPWKTVTYSCQQAQNGDTVHVSSGTYFESNISFANPNVALRGENLPIINGFDVIFDINKSSITLSGLIIISTTTKQWGVIDQTTLPVVNINGAGGSTITGNQITQLGFGGSNITNPEGAGHQPGIYLLNSSTNTIVNNTIVTQNINSPGIQLLGSTRNIITGNNIDSRHSWSIWIEGSSARQDYDSTISGNNGYQNKAIFYYFDVNNTNIDFTGTGVAEIFAAYCDNLGISNVNMEDSDGIIFDNTTNSSITNYTHTDTYTGTVKGIIYKMPKFAHVRSLILRNASYNDISNVNMTTGGRHNYGIYFENGNNNTIDRFNFYSSYISDKDGDAPGGASDSHMDALEMRPGSNNVISNSSITYNGTWSTYPIFMWGGSNNNTFFNNYIYRLGGTDWAPIIRGNNNVFRNERYIMDTNTGGFSISGQNNKIYDSIIDSSLSNNYADYSGYRLEASSAYFVNTKNGDKPGMPGEAGTTNQYYEKNYYLDVLVVNASNAPFPGAAISITNEVDNTNYPSKDVNLTPKTSFATSASGHTPLPTTGNETISPVLTNYYDRITSMIDIYRATMTYTINASASGVGSVSLPGITPSLSWYRSDISIPAYTITAIIHEGSSAAPRITGYAPSEDNPLLDGAKRMFKVWPDQALENTEWYINDVMVSSDSTSYECALSSSARTIYFIGSNANGVVSKLWDLSAQELLLGVTITDPENNELNVPVDKKVTAVFNKNILQSASFNNITVKDSANNLIDTSVSIDKNIMSIVPLNSLAAGFVYTVSIPQGAVKDSYGYDLSAGRSFSFTTALAGIAGDNIPATTETFAYPIPYVQGKNSRLTFTGLHNPSKIEIYSVEGVLIYEKEVDAPSYSFVPEGFSSGVYIYLIKHSNDIKQGKLVIIK